MAATIKQSARGGLYRDALRSYAWGYRCGETNEGHAILRRGPESDYEVFVVPVGRLRRKAKPRSERTLKQKRAGWSRGEKVGEWW